MFLGQTCIDHGNPGVLGQQSCCSGLKAWIYDAKTGAPYPNGTFYCWTATCVPQGLWAGPGGVGNNCCSGLTNVNGKCQVPVSTIPTSPLPPTSGGGTGTSTLPLPGQWISGIPNNYLIIGVVAIAALMMMQKKKGG
jgi:hypothetical protein